MHPHHDDDLPALAELDGVVRRERDLPVPADEAWDLLTDAEGLATWLADEVDLVVEPGAEGTVRDAGGVDRPVYVDEVEEGRRLSFRWEAGDGDLAIVEFALAPIDGGTRLTVTEIPLRVVAVPATVPAGWSMGSGSVGGGAPQALALACR